MNVSRLFIQRPVATGLLMVAIVLSGLLGLKWLPISALPQVDYPTIQVQTLYPGASPDVMSRTVTAPLERQFGQMSGLDRMSSTSAAGVSIVTLQFGLSESMDTAEQQVQAAINGASTFLPADLPSQPVYAKVNPADAPVLTLAIRSDSLPLTEVQNMVNTRLAQKISQVSGVGLVTLAGGQKPAVRIQANIDALAAMNLGLDTVRSAINNANSNSAKGSFDGPTRAYTINANDQLATADQYGEVIVAYKNGAPVRLKDVARVVNGAENDRLGAWAAVLGGASAQADTGTGDGADRAADLRPVILLNVQRQPGANVIATVDAIKKQLPALRDSLPGSVSVDVLTDRTQGIRASVEHVQMELVLAVVMVVLVIFFFLHSLQATVIASIAVPISLLGSAGLMYLLGFSLNNLSLMALTIATGFVVDDAIVMIENISRHMEMGKKPMRAALDGAGEIGFTIVSLTVSLIAVLIPLLFMQEVIGRLFREFAVTLALTILISAVVSLTLVPMMSARWLRSLEEVHGRFGQAVQRGLDGIVHRYDRGLVWVLAHQPLTLVVALATLALTAFLFWLMPKSLFPTQSTGQLQMRVVASPDVSFERMQTLQNQVVRVVMDDAATQSVSSVVGVDAANNTMLNQGSVVVNLRPQGVLGDTQATIMSRLREAVGQQVAGVRIYLQPTQDLTVDSERGPTEYRFEIEGVNTAEVNTWAKKMVELLGQAPEVRNVTTDAGASGPTAMVQTDRDTASRLGISASTIDDTLYNAFGQRIISTIFTETSQYRVILEAVPDADASLHTLEDLPVRTSGSSTTPLSAFAQVKEQSAPLQITRVAQYPAATVSFDTASGVSLGAAVQAIDRVAQEAGMPESLKLSFTGTAGTLASSLSNQVWLLLAAIVCVYIVLGVLYESWVHPLTILSTLPSAGVGALLALWLMGHALDIVGIIGLVLLIGIVKKNAIMMIDFALEAERHQGMSAQDAIHQAALLRFRPILMTTLAALAAALPLMFSWGDGAELRRPLGVSIFGGLVLSQLLTLFTTPVIYLWFDRWGRKWDRMGHAPDDDEPPASQAPAALAAPEGRA
ncbi:multidrug transporter subunit MdtC [Comamonas serinivorans]|uniref:Multidrug transporter subunit MdtC n=1 Tax=Comamonas serinivorans TaxID=1082851 RepID=A0A1Y0EMF4_9BURK|nr:efflux RND transporter permease subunit [Comamonas serinivorans]ARU04578.1 multidrug transporter subunit MdtC [Comamonas serinivorans]